MTEQQGKIPDAIHTKNDICRIALFAYSNQLHAKPIVQD